MTESNEREERRAAIARLVQRGGLRHESPGQYFPGTKTKDDYPPYDYRAIAQAFPQALQMHFDDEFDEGGKLVNISLTIMDGKGPDVVIALGKAVPDSTEKLIKAIHDHYRKAFNLDAMREAEDAFAGFRDDEG